MEVSSLPLADLYRGGFASTKQLAREGDPAATDAVARQFEAYFLGQMLKSMRSASIGDPYGSQTLSSYRELFDHQLTLNLAESGSMGLSTYLHRALQNARPGDPTNHPWEAATPPAGRSQPQIAPTVIRSTETPPSPSVPPTSFATPKEFVRSLMPHAQAASAQLGVAPTVLLAQAALETGWGKHIMHASDGISSHNVFGIKAGGQWSGDVVTKHTLEYQNGVMTKTRAAFRAYSDWSSSFADYATLIGTKPRYADARAVAGDPQAYLQALQDAGYATDPAYASKILRIFQGLAGGDQR
ncbi:MAG: flagellar assembly peptidoglycan hydrolase FlgJ [Pseudomonadota bacterium]